MPDGGREREVSNKVSLFFFAHVHVHVHIRGLILFNSSCPVSFHGLRPERNEPHRERQRGGRDRSGCKPEFPAFGSDEGGCILHIRRRRRRYGFGLSCLTSCRCVSSIVCQSVSFSWILVSMRADHEAELTLFSVVYWGADMLASGLL